MVAGTGGIVPSMFGSARDGIGIIVNTIKVRHCDLGWRQR